MDVSVLPFQVTTPFIVRGTATLLPGYRLGFSRPDDTPSRATFSSWGLIKLTPRLCHADFLAGFEPDTDFTLYMLPITSQEGMAKVPLSAVS